MNKKIEIPFGAKDSELKGWEYTIPEDMEAEIKDGKIIVKQKESEDERIRKDLITFICQFAPEHLKAQYVAYLEKQKEQKPESCDCSRDEESYTNGIHHVLMNPEAYGLIKQKPAEWSEEDKKMFNSLCTVLHGGLSSIPTEQFISWLKSLHPAWKPSDEQMKALEDAFRKDGGNEYRKIINSLYNDLKKLL